MKRKPDAPAEPRFGFGGFGGFGACDDADEPLSVAAAAETAAAQDAEAFDDAPGPSRKKNRRQKLDRKRAGKVRDHDWRDA